MLWIKSREEIIIDHKILDDQKSYIPFNNGIYDLKNDALLESNASFYFTYSINAKFKKKKSLDRTIFNEFLFQITNGDPDQKITRTLWICYLWI
ncbi:hypothetical protein [Lysinibacillus sp. ACHW1.5]|uniref:hypothetical protein n=1 Tax=Lysinibacillus sp. ACHW1.5 TaxID=2913506 RepID=UPI0035304426